MTWQSMCLNMDSGDEVKQEKEEASPLLLCCLVIHMPTSISLSPTRPRYYRY